MDGLEYAIKQETTHYAQGQSKPLVELHWFLGSLPLCVLDGFIGTFCSRGQTCSGQVAYVFVPIKYILLNTRCLLQLYLNLS